ncbi:MAG: RND family transporter [Bacteroidia bacterium]|nr:MAG: RND family transporter [Bacteroidia bacterium]
MRNGFMEKYAGWVIRFRYWVIVSVLMITVLMAYFLKDLEVNADVMSYLPDDDPAAALFNRIGDTYGGNEMVIVGLEGQYVFDPGTLDIIRQVTDSIRSTPGIGYVTSLTNVLDIKGSDWGIEMGRLIDEYDIPQDPVVLDSLKRYTLSKDMYRGNLVSEDAMATLVIGKILTGVNRAGVVEMIMEKLQGFPFEGNIHYGGMPVTLLELSRTILHDIRFIAPLTFIIISLVLLAGFRNARGLILPMLTVLIAVVWTMGLIAMLGYQITMMTNIIPVILLAVGSAYAIHVVNAAMAEQSVNPEGALKRGVTYIVAPVILASITTMFGFLSFIAGSYLMMIREFGVFSAIGILFALLLTISFVPALLAVFEKPLKAPKHPKPPTLFDKIPAKLSMMVFDHRGKLLTIWLAIVMISVWGMTRIERRVDIIDYFRDDSMVKKGEELLKEKFNGSTPLYLHIQGNVQDPEVLRAMEDAQNFMQQFPYIPYSQSVADLIKQMNDVMGEGEIIPDEPYKIAQLWFLLDGQEIMEQLVSPGLEEGVIQAYVTSKELDVLREIETSFTEYAQNNSNEKHKLAFTGIPLMLKRLDDSIISSQTYSLIIAMILVMVMTSLLLRSANRGLVAIIPIGVTLIVLFGTMGITGVPLDIATVLSGSVTIGIGIDYSIHFISRFGEGENEGLGVKESLEKAIRVSGKAIFINMIAVSAGFAMLVFSNLVPLQRFGFLIAITMLTSGMATLTILPMVFWRKEGNK